jgi:membrane-bound lytic murein transglycosylase B
LKVLFTLALTAVLLVPLQAQDSPAPPASPVPPPSPAVPATTQVPDDTPARPFDDWLRDLIADAHTQGFTDSVIDQTLVGLQPIPRVVERDSNQAEFTITLDNYFKSRVTPRIIREGRVQAVRERTLLRRVQAAYGVPPGVVLAIWGLESHYGQFTGAYPVFQALATLAWEPRRSDFFRDELFKALTIVSGGSIDAKQMTGSWAGAMGQPQFMPSSYLDHAVDFDKDGLRDIWKSKADALASIANYLKDYGWTAGQTWGREVKIPDAAREKIADIPMRTEGCPAMRAMTERRPLATWRSAGLRLKSGMPLPRADINASLVETGDRSFLVYPNYEAVLGYNCAHLYALSVTMLADRLQ